MSSRQAAQASRRARVLIVDDHPLVREGLTARISAQPDLEVCGEASDLDEALAMIGSTRPALVILDLALKHGNGLDLIKKIKMRRSRPKVLVVSAYDEALFAERALRAGAQGYINKQELQGSVIEAIRKLLRGELFLSADMTQQLAGQALSGRIALQGVEALTDRELQIFQFIGRGMTTRAIAEELRLSVHTIESHRENIRLKLNLRNGTQLLQQAVLWTLGGER
jgi:DNA-binding NarL/FixJ family response regulator